MIHTSINRRVPVQGRPARILTTEPSAQRTAHPTPVLFLHGWGVSADMMTPLAERLATLGYRGIAPDFPGFGETPPPPAAWNVEDYTAWVGDLLNAVGVDRVHLFAHSFGARVALSFAVQRSEQVEKIALTGAAGIPTPIPPVQSLRLRLYKAVRAALNDVGAVGLSGRLAQWYSRRYGSADYQAVSGVMRQTLVKVVNHDIRPTAVQVTHPTLLLWGERDQDTPLWQAKVLEAAIPDAGLVVFPGGDHFVYLQRLGEISRTLDHFFRH